MTNRSSFRLVAVVAAAIAVTAGCGGADPVSPRLWAASHCDAIVTMREEVKQMRSSAGGDDRLVENLDAAAKLLEESLGVADRFSQQIAAIGPPDVAGGVEWYQAYVDDLRASHENLEVLAAEMLDDLSDLPRTSQVSEAELQLEVRYDELRAANQAEVQRTLEAMPSSLQTAHPVECQSMLRSGSDTEGTVGVGG